MIEDYQSLPSFKKTKRILTIAYAEAFEGQLTCKLLTTQKVEERLTLADSFLNSSSAPVDTRVCGEVDRRRQNSEQAQPLSE